MTLRFHNEHNTMTNDGKVTVRILRTCAAGGEHLSEGCVVKLNPKTATELVVCRAAEYFAAPEPRQETAAAPMVAAENATISTKKRTARRK